MMRRHAQSGQTLIALLVFISVAMMITMASAAVALINTRANSSVTTAEAALQAAESGAENANMQLLRNPSYVGETITVGDATVTITVSGTSSKTIVSQAVIGDYRRTITVAGTYAGNVLTINSWSETP